jgi:hypothetical protein
MAMGYGMDLVDWDAAVHALCCPATLLLADGPGGDCKPKLYPANGPDRFHMFHKHLHSANGVPSAV